MGKGSGGKVDVTEFRMSMHVAVGLAMDSVNRIIVDEKDAWVGNATANTALSINLPDLFGGSKKEGGLFGTIQVLLGKSDQVVPTAVASRYGRTPSTCMGFRGITSLFFHGSGQVTSGLPGVFDLFDGAWNGNIGGNGFAWKTNSPLIAQKIEVDATCKPKTTLNQTYAMIPNPDHPTMPDANPAHMIFEALTDSEFGMGGDPASLDVAAFEAAALTLFNEGFGLSILWLRQTEIEKIVQEILDHIQATVFADPSTGLMSIKLLRDDYSTAGLFTITPDNAKLSNYRVRSAGQIVNEISVSWTNPDSNKEETISVQDIASIQSQGGEKVSASRNYYAVRRISLARDLLARDIRSSTAPLISCDVEIDRSAWSAKPGDVVLLSWPRRNNATLVMRIGKVDRGKPGDSKVRVPLVQDIFSLARQTIPLPPTTEWSDPASAPQPLTMQLTTLPAYFTANAAIQSQPVTLIEPEVLVASLADSQDDDSLDYELVTSTTGPTGATQVVTKGAMSMTPLAHLAATLPAAATSELPAALFPDINQSPSIGGFIWIGYGDANQEIVAVTGRTSTGWTIGRGVLDTVPKQWASGTPVWAVTPGSQIVDVQTIHAAGETVTYRGLDRTSQGLLAYAAAPDVTATLTARPYLPLRPANVAIGGTGFGTYAIGVATTFTVSWAIRNRLFEDSQVLAWTAASVPPEYRQETIVRCYDVATGTMVAEYPWLWTQTSLIFQKTDFARYASVRFTVSSRRDDLESLAGHSVVVSGFANNPVAPLPPAAPARTIPPSPGAAPGVSAFTATASADTGPAGTHAPTIVISGTQDNPDATALVARYRQVGATDWIIQPAVPLTNEAVVFAITGVQPNTTHDVAVAYIVDGEVGQFRDLADVLTSFGARPGSNLLFNGGMSLGQQGFDAGTVVTNDPASGNYLAIPAGSNRLTPRYPCGAETSFVLSCESVFHLSTGHLLYVVFWNAANGYLDEGSYCGTGSGWARTAGAPKTSPTGTASYSIHSTAPALGGGYAVFRKIKLEAGTVATTWNDDATNGAVYRDGTVIDTLRPAEPGATLGATWGVDVDSRPTELIDGRIATAINAGGVLQTPIPDTLATTSNLLRRTGGGVYTGDLAANLTTNTNQLTDGANLGGTATWGGISSRPPELTDGRVAAAINAAGAVKKVTTATSLIHSTGAVSAVGGQPFSMVAGDGQVITFPVTYGVPPLVIPVAADNLNALVTAGDYYQTGAVSVSATGFTGRARRRNPGTGGTTVARTDDGAGNATTAGNARTLFRNKALSGVAHDRRYTATFQIRMIDADQGGGVYEHQSMTVGLYGRQTIAGDWVLLTSGAYVSSTAGLTTTTEVLNGDVDWTEWNTYGDWEYKLHIISGYSIDRMCLYDFISVQWTEITGATDPVDVTALSGGRKLTYLVFPLAG